tara:strand:+ start:374 stop:883 length:510 start_codon:yes stop_codon:yes gene_type:complete
MLKIINELEPFIKDCYKRISVREYAKLIGISPPTASKLLKDFRKDNILIEEKDRNYIFYYANQKSRIFIDLSRLFWKQKLDNLIDIINNKSPLATTILFGSLSKAETTSNSDIDIAVIGSNNKFNLNNIEKKLNRKIQLFEYYKFKDIKNIELKNNIINGYVLKGKIRI